MKTHFSIEEDEDADEKFENDGECSNDEPGNKKCSFNLK